MCRVPEWFIPYTTMYTIVLCFVFLLSIMCCLPLPVMNFQKCMVLACEACMFPQQLALPIYSCWVLTYKNVSLKLRTRLNLILCVSFCFQRRLLATKVLSDLDIFTDVIEFPRVYKGQNSRVKWLHTFIQHERKYCLLSVCWFIELGPTLSTIPAVGSDSHIRWKRRQQLLPWYKFY